jgi:hypothetical protein
MADFGVSGVESSGSDAIVFVNIRVFTKENLKQRRLKIR